MAKQRIFDLPETKGTFVMKGIVSGTAKDSFYVEKETSTKKDMRVVNFGMDVEEGKTLYTTLQAFPSAKVFFSKQGKAGEKSVTESIDWNKRFSFNKEGFKVIGLTLGLTKTVDDKGKVVNEHKNATTFDGCKMIKEDLKDGQSVFVRGKLEYSSYRTNNGEMRKSTKLVPNQIYLCGDIDFSDDTYVPVHDFTQNIVFMGIEQEKENERPTGRFILSAKIVNYASIEDAEFIVENKAFASQLKKNLKPYNAIKVWGRMDSRTLAQEVEEEEDCWGEANSMTKVSAPTRREFILTGADKNSVDVELYTEAKIQEAMRLIQDAKNAKTDFGEPEKDGWGSSSNFADEDSDDEW